MTGYGCFFVWGAPAPVVCRPGFWPGLFHIPDLPPTSLDSFGPDGYHAVP